VLLFHRTTEAAAPSILAEGFRDTHFVAEEGMERGVWFSEDPREWALGAPVLLAVQIPDDQLRQEWRSTLYPIEWQIPSRNLRELGVEVLRITETIWGDGPAV
jgi:hypothetical protein